MITQRRAGVVSPEDAAFLKERYDLLDKWIKSTGCDVRDEDEPVAGICLHQIVDRRGDRARRPNE